MRNLTRKFVTFAVAGALLLPTAAVANAQSSFGFGSISSSFDTGSSTADLPTTTRLEKGFERLGEAYGQKLNQTEEDKATELLQQALNNELPIIEGQYEEFNFIDSSRYLVKVFTEEQADDFLSQLSKAVRDAQEAPENNVADFGVSVAQEGDLYYVAIVQKETSGGTGPIIGG